MLAILSFASAETLLPSPSTGTSPISDGISAPTLIPIEDGSHLQLRQAAPVTNPQATPVAVQAPTVTTNWVRTEINGVVTYVQLAYTQTFAAVPDQWPSPGVGQIGLGTLKSKRGIAPATAEETGLAGRPVEVVMRDALVKQTLSVLEVVEVIETRTVVEWSTVTLWNNGSIAGTGTGYVTGTGLTAYGTGAPALSSGRPFALRYYFFG
ncbi:hypothetical protein B0A48_01320 [Cryoendolithus antarcticus]|uniref:Uncharacterized protein n=1 Tax=Cryoendolithus antarcticus TaxID=1507870 RepID=A0A1V8TSW5_9PEZI|nr:hypothetical protein B0A48_01320 [Cryoendolithus antarcticus]